MSIQDIKFKKLNINLGIHPKDKNKYVRFCFTNGNAGKVKFFSDIHSTYDFSFYTGYFINNDKMDISPFSLPYSFITNCKTKLIRKCPQISEETFEIIKTFYENIPNEGITIDEILETETKLIISQAKEKNYIRVLGL